MLRNVFNINKAHLSAEHLRIVENLKATEAKIQH